MGVRDPWGALHERLRTAMLDGFAAVMDASLAAALGDLFDACLGPDAPAELVRFRDDLAAFDRLGRQDRCVLVARGMRLCATHRPRTVPAPSPPRRPPAGDVVPRLPDVEVPAPAPVSGLPGVGPSTQAKLVARGLQDVVELAYLLPAGYEDRRARTPLSQLVDGELAVVEGRARSLRQGFARGRFMATLELEVDDPKLGSIPVVARWFHRVGGLDKWAKGQPVLAIGPVRDYKGTRTMAHPELRDPADPGPPIAVRYPLVEGIPARTLAKIVGAAVDRLCSEDPLSLGFLDALPQDIAAEHGFMGQLEALRSLHRPDPELDGAGVQALSDGSSPAHRRLAFDEFFFFQLAVLLERGQLRAQRAAVAMRDDAFDPERLRACLPFEPTGAQWRVLRELEQDMSEGAPMLRLLQGDVGSGKTAVAFGAALAMIHCGGQVALMAPTEILAEQHARTLRPWCERAGLSMEVLTGATPRAVRASRLALLADGKIDLLVGTHALLTSDVAFRELGLVVVDEQHRFGVEQRAVLRRKGTMPHLLVMTATPIPRTMALCAYGELEVSVIDEMPPGREPPQTFLLTGKRGLDKVRRGVAKRVAAGDQVFVVCPLVEASEALEVTDVEATAAALRTHVPDRVVEVIHGRMSSRDKDAVMRRFREREVDVLVATTVIEVGVDIPDARVMVVEHAERFGLAQLHQLRGRVGRGGGASYCLLHTASGPNSDAAQRLAVMTETADGFVVAERDLALRGPGEIFGTRQAGAPRLRYARFGGEGTRLLVAAREAAKALLQRDPGLHRHPWVRAELKRRRAGEAALSADAG